MTEKDKEWLRGDQWSSEQIVEIAALDDEDDGVDDDHDCGEDTCCCS